MGSQFSCGIQVGDHSLFLGVEFDNEIYYGDSCCGSDAFYRDAFLEYKEPPPNRSAKMVKALEQAKLKAKKGAVFAQHAVSSVKNEASKAKEKLKVIRRNTLERASSFDTVNADDQAPPVRVISKDKMNGSMDPICVEIFEDWLRTSTFVGKTIPECHLADLSSPKNGPCWKKGDGLGLPVRAGPDYARRRATIKTQSHMYDCLTLDGIRSGHIFEDIVGNVIRTVPPPSRGSLWTPDCPLPRVLCINVKLPYYNPKNPFAKENGGCSFVGFFEIANETLQAVNSENPPPCVRLFREFCEGPAGKPGVPGDPNRSLSLRKNGSNTKDLDTGIFKAAGWCENEDELGVPQFLRQFNGKSFVITDSGYVVKDPAGEWMELGFDVRHFPILFRDALYTFQNFLPKAQYHVGFMVQASHDEYLPEGLLCDLYVSGVDIAAHPWVIANGTS